MKYTSVAFTGLLCACLSCTQNEKPQNDAVFLSSQGSKSIPDQTISVHEANKMISSYLNSLPASAADTDLKSFFLDARLLRKYLDSIPSADSIAMVKIMLAHNLDYINAGDSNKFAGYKPNALTIILTAISSSGDYILLPGRQVMEHAMPCPPDCPSGEASLNYIK